MLVLRGGIVVDGDAVVGEPLGICSAHLCQTKGVGSSFQAAAHASMSAASSLTEQWAERWSFLVVSREPPL
jgi:hypothetical protein